MSLSDTGPRGDEPIAGSAFDALLTAAAGGDEQAFAVLWRRLQPGLMRYLQALAPETAEDLASETWLRVVAGLRRFRGDERAFRAWLFTVARHRVIDGWRAGNRRPVAGLPVEALAEWRAPDDVAGQVVESLSARQAVTLLAGLPQAQAEVVLLRVVAGLEVDEVARIVGKRPGTVRVLAHRGLRRLAEWLAAEDGVRAG